MYLKHVLRRYLDVWGVGIIINYYFWIPINQPGNQWKMWMFFVDHLNMILIDDDNDDRHRNLKLNTPAISGGKCTEEGWRGNEQWGVGKII